MRWPASTDRLDPSAERCPEITTVMLVARRSGLTKVRWAGVGPTQVAPPRADAVKGASPDALRSKQGRRHTVVAAGRAGEPHGAC